MITEYSRGSNVLLGGALVAAVIFSTAVPAAAESERTHRDAGSAQSDAVVAQAAGFDDLVILDQFEGVSYVTSVAEGTPSQPLGATTTWTASGTRLLGGDLQNDGAGDAVIVRFVTGGFQIWAVPWNFDGRFYDAAAKTVWSLVTGGGFNFSASRQLMGDVTGDGLDDIVTIHKQATGGLRAWVHQNTGSSFAAPVQWQNLSTGGWSYDSSRQTLADVNFDGRMDLVSTHKQATGGLRLWVHLSTAGTSFDAPVLWSNLNTGGWSYANSRQSAGDIDGDGDWDMVSSHRQSTGGLRLWAHLSDATSFAAPVLWTDLRTGGWSYANSQQVVLDGNDDGVDDVITAHRTNNNLYRLWGHISTGSGFDAPFLIWNPDPTFLYDGTEFAASRF